jgi:hypothetical protein
MRSKRLAMTVGALAVLGSAGLAVPQAAHAAVHTATHAAVHDSTGTLTINEDTYSDPTTGCYNTNPVGDLVNLVDNQTDGGVIIWSEPSCLGQPVQWVAPGDSIDFTKGTSVQVLP